MTPVYLVATIFCLISELNSQNIGSFCVLDNGLNGVCSSVNNCPSVLASIQNRERPKLCAFLAEEPIVCCPLSSVVKNGKLSSILHRPECAILENAPIRSVFSTIFESGTLMSAEPPMQLRVQRATPTELKRKLGLDVQSVAGGLKVERAEFPHMARLGTGENESNIEWYCGGSLISDKFILTAAHCIHSSFGTINWALLGDPESPFLQERVRIINNIVHPNFNHSQHYHDLAISELQERLSFRSNILPACLYAEREIPTGAPITVTGWGSTEFGGDASKDLLKADVALFTYQECSQKYGESLKKLSKGIDEATQFCAGGRTEVKDTCQGDSGGPIQIRVTNTNRRAIYSLIGVTSFGKPCGFVNQPGVYVRLFPYLAWIESIVLS